MTPNNSEDQCEVICFLSEHEGCNNKGGLRTKGYLKKSYKQKPLITIITVVYNGDKYLEETILSVIKQSYNNIEYIIIDGGSTDKTLEIIQQYETKIDYWISETDQGIYDAMNKGINLASGKWINFMNAGDSLHNESTIDKIFLNYNCADTIDVIYGDNLIIYSEYQNISILRKAGSLKYLWKGMQFSHQSTFISTSYIKKNKFDTSYRIIADFSLIYHMYEQNMTFLYVPKTISSIRTGGVSDRERIKCYIESLNFMTQYNDGFFVYMYYVFKIIDALAREFLKKVLPSKIVIKIIKNKLI